MAGVGSAAVNTGVLGVSLVEKKSFLDRSSDMGVVGLRSGRLEASVLLRKLLSIVLNSLSGSESAIEDDEDSLLILRMSGAFSA